jgi:hypothetical protein
VLGKAGMGGGESVVEAGDLLFEILAELVELCFFFCQNVIDS